MAARGVAAGRPRAERHRHGGGGDCGAVDRRVWRHACRDRQESRLQEHRRRAADDRAGRGRRPQPPQSAVGVRARRDDAGLVDADSRVSRHDPGAARGEASVARCQRVREPRRAGAAARIAARPVCGLGWIDLASDQLLLPADPAVDRAAHAGARDARSLSARPGVVPPEPRAGRPLPCLPSRSGGGALQSAAFRRR